MKTNQKSFKEVFEKFKKIEDKLKSIISSKDFQEKLTKLGGKGNEK
jgi:hypothetical protein